MQAQNTRPETTTNDDYLAYGGNCLLRRGTEVEWHTWDGFQWRSTHDSEWDAMDAYTQSEELLTTAGLL